MFGDDPSSSMMTIAKFCILLVIGVVILSNLISGNSTLSHTGTIQLTFSENPVDGETITIDGTIYEFDSNGAIDTGHTAVAIGALKHDTIVNLQAALASKYTVVIL